MSNHRARVSRIERLKERTGRVISNWWSAVRFLEAHARGAVLCKDGKERTFEEWVQTLDPITAAQVSNLGITSREQGPETKE